MKDILKLSPLFIFYVAFIILFHAKAFWGDETGYLHFANNLIHGFYADKENLRIWWGPGYPLILAPFVYAHAPVIIMRLLNAVFLFCAVLFFHFTLCEYSNNKINVIASYLLGLYPPSILLSTSLYTESIALLLVSGIVYCFSLYTTKGNYPIRYAVLCSFFIAYLCLTKVLFGYVVLLSLLLSIAAFVIFRCSIYRNLSAILLVSLFICSPYLIYTYSVTGKIFYWGNSGGMSLYWMSTPYADEYGDWHSTVDLYNNHNLWENHHEFFDSLKGLNVVDSDNKFKSKAIDNIVHKPIKYATNVLCNIGRIIFSYPFSYTEQKPSTYFYSLPNMFIFVIMFMCMTLIIIRKVTIPIEHLLLTVFMFIYLSGSFLLSAYTRMFNIVLPIFLLVVMDIISRYSLRARIEI